MSTTLTFTFSRGDQSQTWRAVFCGEMDGDLSHRLSEALGEGATFHPAACGVPIVPTLPDILEDTLDDGECVLSVKEYVGSTPDLDEVCDEQSYYGVDPALPTIEGFVDSMEQNTHEAIASQELSIWMAVNAPNQVREWLTPAGQRWLAKWFSRQLEGMSIGEHLEVHDQPCGDAMLGLRAISVAAGKYLVAMCGPEGVWQDAGEVAVDSGQLMICDPCYIENHWKSSSFEDVRRYAVTADDGTEVEAVYPTHFQNFAEPLPQFGGQSMNDLVEAGKARKLERAVSDEFSYNGASQTTIAQPAGQLCGSNGFPVAVATRTGWGDGSYPAQVRIDPETGRVAEVRVTFA